jgi:hypothetical protein
VTTQKPCAQDGWQADSTRPAILSRYLRLRQRDPRYPSPLQGSDDIAATMMRDQA